MHAIDLRALADAGGYRTEPDETAKADSSTSDHVIIPCRHGQILAFSDTELAAQTTSLRAFSLLMPIPSVRLRKRSQDEITISFGATALAAVCRVLRAQRKFRSNPAASALATR
jgi:hypothetical protein